jgi:hypothetical protein
MSSEIPIANPLGRFPSKRPDSTLKAYFGSSLGGINKKQELSVDWLHPSRLDPSFGVQGTGDLATIRRTYRRIESSNVFVPPRLDEALLSEIVQRSPPKKRNLVMVEASRLEEYMKFETVLRQEKKRLEDQCLLATAPLIAGHKSPPNIPMPATRMAIHSACEAEMKSVAVEINDMNDKWTQFCKTKHYNRDRYATAVAQLQPLPLTMRLMKLQQIQRESEEWYLNKDRDTMMFEDDMSRLVNRYQNAQNRKVDYDRYYILATRYGIWNEDKFYVDAAPGHRYWIAALRGAKLMQRLWSRYWIYTSRRRYHASVRIQVLFHVLH